MNSRYTGHKKNQLVMLTLAIVLSVLLAPGISRLSFDDEYRNIFRFDSLVYQNYQEMLRLFPDSESDFILIVSGGIFDPDNFTRVVTLVDLLSGLPGASYVLSMVSLPVVEELITDPFTLERVSPIGSAIVEKLEAQHKIDPAPFEFLVSANQDAQQVIIRLNPGLQSDTARLKQFKLDIEFAAGQVYGADATDILIAGAPAMKVALHDQATLDTVRLNIIATILATIVALILFRSIRVLVVISAGPTLGTIWTLGIMELAGDKMTVFTSILIPLLFVIGYTNAAHIIFRVLGYDKKASRWQKSWYSITSVVKACFISAVTTGIGFASLTLSGSDLVAQFGFYCALGSMLVFLSVILVTPALSALLDIGNRANSTRITRIGVNQLGLLGNWVWKRKSAITKIGIICSGLLVIVAFQVVPDYQFKENFSPDNDFYRAIEAGDKKFSGLLTANVVVDWSQDNKFESADLFDIENKVDQLARDGFATGRVLSYTSLFSSVLRTQIDSMLDLKQHVPDYIAERFINSDQRRSLITIPLPDIGARLLIPELNSFRAKLVKLSSQYPNLSLELTGIVPVAMYGSQHNIREMAKSLAYAIIAIFIVITISLGSIRLGLICMLPNILPIAGVASLLAMAGVPLQYNSVLVFTICLGIAVDDTVHFILRYRSELFRSDDIAQALDQSIRHIGLVLIFTSCILGAGFFSLMFSSVTVVTLMGLLSCIALILALLADLIFLPALLTSPFSVNAMRK